MNTTIAYTPFLSNTGEPDYLALSGFGLFMVSEILPFIKKGKENNGLIHTLICILKGSRCMADKLLSVIENDIENPPKVGGTGEIGVVIEE